MSNKTPNQLPWVEKYRPKKLDDVVNQEEAVQALKNTIVEGNMPHLLFYGPPGTGKTSLILAIARQLYGPEIMKDRVLELNASHERGIDVVRDRIKNFARIAINHNQKADGHPVPPFKIIILDEADCMTKDAQSALRRTMENYSHVTRFCIICNYVSRIISPVTSRCAKFRFKSVNNESMFNRLEYICQQESLKYQPQALRVLMQVSAGDMRRAIGLLQTAGLVINSTAGEEVDEKIIYEVCGSVPMEIPAKLWAQAKTNDIQLMTRAVNDVIRLGYPVDQVVGRLMDYLLQLRVEQGDEVSDLGLSQLAIRIGEVERRLIAGASEQVQLLDVMSCCIEVCHDKEHHQ